MLYSTRQPTHVPKKLLQNIGIALYLFFTAYAFFFTMVRIELPFIPNRMLHFFYGMMAPYQGYTIENFDLLAEGKKGENWERINLDPYYPMILGNQVMFRRLRSFHAESEEVSRKKYAELATLLLKQEKEKGQAFERIRLTWQAWPMSIRAWDALRRDPLIKNYPLTEVP